MRNPHRRLKKSPFDDLVPALGIYQRLQLVDCQIFATARLLSHFTYEIELFGGIDGHDSLFVGTVDSRAERSVIGDDRIVAQSTSGSQYAVFADLRYLERNSLLTS